MSDFGAPRSRNFRSVIYVNLAVGDAGATGLLMRLCCVNAGREKRSRAPKNRRNIGKTGNNGWTFPREDSERRESTSFLSVPEAKPKSHASITYQHHDCAVVRAPT